MCPRNHRYRDALLPVTTCTPFALQTAVHHTARGSGIRTDEKGPRITQAPGYPKRVQRAYRTTVHRITYRMELAYRGKLFEILADYSRMSSTLRRINLGRLPLVALSLRAQET